MQARAEELADLEELGVVRDTLLVHPSQAQALRQAYADNLGAMLESVGLPCTANPPIPNGTAFVCQSGMVGTMAFESPCGLVVETHDEPTWRTTATTRRVFGTGYPKAMERMLSANQGLRRRFSTTIVFESYTPDELWQLTLSRYC